MAVLFGAAHILEKNDWLKKIKEISNIYQNEPDRVLEFCQRLSIGINEVESIVLNKNEIEFYSSDLNKMMDKWLSTI